MQTLSSFPTYSKKSSRTYIHVALAFCSLVICSKIYLPLSLIPTTMQTFAIYCIGLFCAPQEAFISIFSFLVLGATNLPVFASHCPGILVLTGPTSGYLIGMLIAAPMIALIKSKIKHVSFIKLAVCCFIGCCLVHVFGLLRLLLILKMSSALAVGLIPFIFGEVCKISIALSLKFSMQNTD